MSVFVDTSGLLAVLDADDTGHLRAANAWRTLLDDEESLITTSYVLVEVFALAQARLGIQAVGVLDRDVVPVLRIVRVDEPVHRTGLAALLAARRRGLSLVDCVSFEVMRRTNTRRAFALDRHFRQQGFELVP